MAPAPIRTATIVVGLLAAQAGILALAPAAHATPTPVALSCTAHSPAGDKSLTLSPSLDVTAPATVKPGDAFSEQIAFVPLPLPNDVQGYHLNYVKSIVVRYRVNNATNITATADGSSLPVSGGVITLSAPAQVNTPGTLTLPTVTVNATAPGSPGTIVTDVPGTSVADNTLHLEVGIQAGLFNFGVPTDCWADPAAPVLATTNVAVPAPTVTVSVADAAVVRPAAGATAPISFPVTLSGPAATPVTVLYQTADGTGTGGIDYTPTAGTLTIPAGSTTASVAVPVLGRAATTSSTFTLKLTNPTGATITSATATGTITPAAPPSLTASQKLVRAFALDYLGREPTKAELTGIGAALDAKTVTQAQLAKERSVSTEWLTTFLKRFYHDTLGRRLDASGLDYYLARLKAGLPMSRVVAELYSSNEYFTGFGKSNVRTWVTDLYQKLLLRTPDRAGLDFWVKRTAAAGRLSVVAAFENEHEPRKDRVAPLLVTLLGRPGTPAELTTYGTMLRKVDDVAVSATIGASPEYLARSQTR